ncbi:MAG: hypothetical protein B7Y50_02605 [Hydrogenophilales bacterium 28-61-11]|nr:MAG: hypothetical protein B7Y50_02605 [Hydrogenophilales bacterium 28-61-11]OYZ57324.1 MAG: hypothetical protein B7Y21_08010 [Hydrogenophilales bacterium 16-61-112]OZA50378.1 MAG: hypothetical protein B7X81_01440 [Hydrogenophilales bacterium 17-61-76]
MFVRSLATARQYALVGLVLLGSLVGVILALYFYRFHTELSLDNATWGQFGDYVGGVINPILGFFSFITLLLALQVQASQSETAVAAFAQAQRDSVRAGEDALRGSEIIQSIARTLSVQSDAARTTAELLALTHSLVIVNESIKEDEAYGGVLETKRLTQLRDQRVQLTSRILQLAQLQEPRNERRQ